MTSFKSFVPPGRPEKAPATGGKLSGNQNGRPAMLFKKRTGKSKEFGLWPTLRKLCSARFVQMFSVGF
jgi:hypothetical protein